MNNIQIGNFEMHWIKCGNVKDGWAELSWGRSDFSEKCEGIEIPVSRCLVRCHVLDESMPRVLYWNEVVHVE